MSHKNAINSKIWSKFNPQARSFLEFQKNGQKLSHKNAINLINYVKIFLEFSSQGISFFSLFLTRNQKPKNAMGRSGFIFIDYLIGNHTLCIVEAHGCIRNEGDLVTAAKLVNSERIDFLVGIVPQLSDGEKQHECEYQEVYHQRTANVNNLEIVKWIMSIGCEEITKCFPKQGPYEDLMQHFNREFPKPSCSVVPNGFEDFYNYI